MRRVTTVVLVAGLLAVPGTAGAHDAVRNDGNDTRGPLDLRSAEVAHKGEGVVVHILSTFRPWKAKLLQHGSYFVVAFDTDGDPSDFERCALGFYRGSLRGQLTNCGRRKVGRVGARKLNGRDIRFTVGLGKLVGEEGGDYGWEAFSFYRDSRGCSKACGDVTPNHPPEIFHDLTPPAIALSSIPDPTTDASADRSFPVEFTVSDHAGSGIASWKLRERPVGGTDWTVAGRGSDPGHQSVDVTGASEGDQLEFQVLARDRQDNTTESVPEDARVTVPVDDANVGIVYAGPGGATDWTATSHGSPSYFEGTRHTSAVVDATATFSFSGTELRLIGGPGPSTFSVSIDGRQPLNRSTTGATAKRSVVAAFNVSPGAHTAEIKVASGTFILDGYAASSY